MSRVQISDLCGRFGYPAFVAEHLAGIIDVLREESVRSIILGGSASRGELMVGPEPSSLISDYELWVITDQADKGTQHKSRQARLNSLEANMREASPCCQIDVSFVTTARLRKAPPTFAMFELKTTGTTLYGDDVQHLLPDVTAASLHRGHLREASTIWRLWKQLECTPVAMHPEQWSSQQASQFIATRTRAILDAVTWAVAESGLMMSGIRPRVEAFLQEFGSGEWSPYFGSKFPEVASTALAMRDRREWLMSPATLQAEAVTATQAAARFCLGRSRRDDSGVAESAALLGAVLAPESLKRRLFYAARAVERVPTFGIPGAARWLLTNKKATLAVAADRALNQYSSWLSGNVSEPDVSGELQAARAALGHARAPSTAAPWSDWTPLVSLISEEMFTMHRGLRRN